jgi:hypothetical protein
MTPGTLVRTKRPRLGVPRGTYGLIVRSAKTDSNAIIHELQLIGDDLRKILRMERDLEIVQ